MRDDGIVLLRRLMPESKPRISLPVAMRLLEEGRLLPPREGLGRLVWPTLEDEIMEMIDE